MLAFDAAGAIIGASVDYTDTTVSGPEQRYWIGFTSPTPPITPGALLLSGGSTGARFKPCVRPGNEYFAGQLAEKVRLARINKGEWPYRHLVPRGDRYRCEPDRFHSDSRTEHANNGASVPGAFGIPFLDGRNT